SFDLEPGYEDPGSILAGDFGSQVFISEDGGETWALVGAGTTTGCAAVLTGTNKTWVAFDPDYATNDTIYAAAGSVIARCTIDTELTWAKQEWVELCDGLNDAHGIKAVGDTVLYVTDDDQVEDDECTGPPLLEGGAATCLPLTTPAVKVSVVASSMS
ncbi:unnamed protein product, partial [marine sediment metagenome]